MNEALVICVVGCAAFVGGYYVGLFRYGLELRRHVHRNPEPFKRLLEDLGKTTPPAEPDAPPSSFAVARSERRPTWRERRKQLEAAARKERERIEAWRG